MTSPSSTALHVPLLDAAREGRLLEWQGQAMQLKAAATWAEAHPANDVEPAAMLGGDTGLALAGEGCPLVSEFAVIELAATLGLTQAAGRRLVATALELKHRLPRVWARVMELQVPGWQAQRLAEQTTHLTLEAVTWVDAQVAPFAHHLRASEIDRVINTALDRYMPALAQERRDAAAEGRHVTIDTRQPTFHGTAQVFAELDLPDALDLEHAVADGATQLKHLGSTESLDVRRAKALGEIARNQLALDLSGPTEARPSHPRRAAVLYLHLDPLTGRGWSEQAGTDLTADTIREWLQVPGTNVTVRPVLDLNEQLTSAAYVPPPLLREQVILIRDTCAFPSCTKHIRKGDLDHIVPFDDGGQTTTINLAGLCRTHHRIKTHGGWWYTAIGAGVFQWHSPLGRTYLVDQHGTLDLTPAAAHPPDQ